MRIDKRLVGVAGGVLALSCGWAALAQAPAAASAGVYSKAQAERGAAQYASACAACHGPSLEGADVNPSLAGARFLGAWQGQTVAALSTRIRTTMPLDNPGSLGLAASTDLTAYLLQANGFPSRDADLPSSNGEQETLSIDAPPAAK